MATNAGAGLSQDAVYVESSAVSVAKIGEVKAALEHWQPAIPTSVVRHYFGTAGCLVQDEAVLKAVACEAQLFLTDLIYDARQARHLKQAGREGQRKTAQSGKTSAAAASAVAAVNAITQATAGFRAQDQLSGTSADELKSVLTAEDFTQALENAGVPALRAPYLS